MAPTSSRVEVVVVGAGLAGLVAAARAAELGTVTLLLDKGGPGEGNTQTTSGMYYTGGIYVNSVPDELYARAMRGGAASPELARMWAGTARRALEWLEHVGVEVDKRGEDTPRLEPRSSISPAPVYRVDVGPNITKKLRAFYEKQQGVSMSKTRAVKLVTSGGRVAGVEAIDSSGNKLLVRAIATILATGGFQANRELLKKNVAKHADRCKLLGSSSATGDGLKMAMNAHAKAVNMGYLYAKLIAYKALTDDRFWPYPTLDTLVEDGVVVDVKGRRFFDESWGDVPLANTLARWDDAKAFLIFDEAGWERAKGDPDSVVPANPWLLEKEGGLYKSDSASDLARKLGVDIKGLETTLERFNFAATRRRMGDLAVPRMNNARALKPPLFGLRMIPGIVSTMGGPLVDRRASVLDRNDRPIPGLFAAGDVVGGLMGGKSGGYVGGISQAAATGLIAGESVNKLVLATPR